MKIKVFSKLGEKKGDITYKLDTNALSDLVVTEYINYIRANKRNNIAKVLDRSEVSGGGRKPWKQKGTGNARVGSNRSPIWSGGGVTFGPSGQEVYNKKINKKVIKGAKLSILNKFSEEGKLVAIEDINNIDLSTKNADNLLSKLGLEGKITVILSDKKGNAFKSFRNLPYVEILLFEKLDLSKSLASDYIVLEEKIVGKLIEDKK